MAILSLQETLVDIRLSADLTETPDATVALVVNELLDASEAIIRDYAGPDTPDAVLGVAQARMVGYLYDQNPAGRQQHQDGFRASGAMALLSSWHIPRTA